MRRTPEELEAAALLVGFCLIAAPLIFLILLLLGY